MIACSMGVVSLLPQQAGRTAERQWQSWGEGEDELLSCCFHRCRMGITPLTTQVWVTEPAMAILATACSTQYVPHTVFNALGDGYFRDRCLTDEKVGPRKVRLSNYSK